MAVEWQGGFGLAEDELHDDEFADEAGCGWHSGASRDALIFLVEVAASMLVRGAALPDGGGAPEQNALQLALLCAKVTLQNKIVAGGADLVGVVLAGVGADAATRADMPGVAVLQPLAPPDAPRVLALEGLLAPDAADASLQCVLGADHAATGCVLNDALWTCQNMFASAKQRLGSKRVFLCTSESAPHVAAPHLRRQLRTKLRDLKDTGCSVVLLPLGPEPRFQFDAFYAEALADEDESQLRDVTRSVDELLECVRSRQHQRRALGHLPLELGEGVSLEVGVYAMLRRATVPTAQRLAKRSNEPVTTHSRRYLAATGQLLLPQDLKKAVCVAGRQALFEVDEVRQMRSLCPVGLRLICFKPRALLKLAHQVRTAQFIYPHEAGTAGSSVAFCALLRRCVARDVVAVCRYTARAGQPPRLVVLLPQEEHCAEDGEQLRPPGFHVVFLPYGDDFRSLDGKLDSCAVPSTAAIDAAKVLVKALAIRGRFHPEQIENPALQLHLANVEAMALDRDAPQELEDLTVVQYPAVVKRKACEAAATLRAITGYCNVPQGSGVAAATAAKRQREAFVVAKLDLAVEAREGRLDKHTVAVLKQLMLEAKVKSEASRKADIIKDIDRHFAR